jgi:hypothetical protein
MDDRPSIAEILNHIPVIDHAEDWAADLIQGCSGWLYGMRIGFERQPIHLLRNAFRHGPRKG